MSVSGAAGLGGARLSKAKRKPANQPESLFRRRDFEGRERELMEGHSSSSSDACLQKQRGVRSQSAQQQQTHTHTHITTPHSITASFFSTSSPSLSSRPSVLPPLTPSFSFSLPLPGAHRHPCAVRAISAASGHSNKHKHGRACVVCQRGQRFPSPPLRLSLLSVRAWVVRVRVSACQLSACLLALAPQLAAPRCLSTSITTTAGPSGLVVDTLCKQSLLAALSASTACPSASLPCPAWLCWIAPAAPENPPSHHRIPTGTPAPSQPVSQSSVSCTKTVSCSLDQAATSATTSPESSARAGPDISYLLAVASSARSPPPPPVTSSTSPHLRQSRLHHPATPPPTTTRQPLTNPSPVDDLFT